MDATEVFEKLWKLATKAQLNQQELKELLLSKDKRGRTAWHWVVKSGNIKILELLWEWAVELNLKYDLLLAKDAYGRTGWCWAAQYGNPEVLEKLLKLSKEAQLNIRDDLFLAKDSYGTVWHWAAKNRNEGVLEKLWQLGEEANVHLNDLLTAWPSAAAGGNIGVLEMLRKLTQTWQNKYGLSVDESRHIQIAWFSAAEDNKVEVLKVLWDWAKQSELSLREDLFLARNSDGKSVWHVAASRGHTEALEMLCKWADSEKLDLKNDMFMAKDKNGNTVWHWLAQLTDDGKVFKKLFDWVEGNINLFLDKNIQGRTTWFLAVWMGQIEVLESLWDLAENQKVNLKRDLLLAADKYGLTALYGAAQNCKINALDKVWTWAKEKLESQELKSLLIQRHENIRTIWCGVVHSGRLEVLDKVWQWAKKELNQQELKQVVLHKCGDGKTMWHWAADRNQAIIVNRLWVWANEAKLNMQELKELLLAEDNEGQTVLEVLEKNYFLRESHGLLKKVKRDLSKEGDTPLMWAAEKGRVSAAKSLLKLCPDIDATNHKGMTALHLAAEKSHLEMVQLLIKEKANPHLRDNQQRTPFDIAQAKLSCEGHSETVQETLEIITVLLKSVTDIQHSVVAETSSSEL